MAERGAGGRGMGTERGARVTEIGWSTERLFCHSRSAHMLRSSQARDIDLPTQS